MRIAKKGTASGKRNATAPPRSIWNRAADFRCPSTRPTAASRRRRRGWDWNWRWWRESWRSRRLHPGATRRDEPRECENSGQKLTERFHTSSFRSVGGGVPGPSLNTVNIAHVRNIEKWLLSHRKRSICGGYEAAKGISDSDWIHHGFGAAYLVLPGFNGYIACCFRTARRHHDEFAGRKGGESFSFL